MPVHGHPVAAGSLTGPLNSLPIDLDLAARLRASYALMRADDCRLADRFYARLFAAAPQLRPLFREGPAAQARKLTAALDLVVEQLEHPGQNAAMLAALGQRHAAYGARPEHYDLVIDLLVESMREVLGDRAPPATLDDWRLVLRLISNQMIAAVPAP